MREIGSEFWQQYPPVFTEVAENEVYLLSGRTALRFIIDDIFKYRKIRKVLLPSYCCESMIQPFLSMGIDVQFYQVGFSHIDYPYDNDADVILLIDFFGYANPQNYEIARVEKQAGKIIIYDATHKINGNPQVQQYADYSFCSYRKWFYCNFSKVVKYNGLFNDDIVLKSNNLYIDIRNKAALQKAEYMAGITKEKESYLSNFSLAEQILDEDYVGYSGEPVSFDINEIVFKRRENATYLISQLRKFSEIKLWKDGIQSGDAPLFVPILIDPHIRNDLRSALIKENIYCPIHWPKSPLHGECNELYDMELSLICDQRYDIADMERMIKVIKEYFSR